MKKIRAFLFKLHPVTKLLITVLFTAVIFFVDTLPVAAVMALCFFICCLFAKFPLKKIFPYAKTLVFIILFVLLLQVFFGQGLLTGLMLGCRITALSILMPALMLTTDARLLAYGITKLGINYRTAFIITSALNMIPVFAGEAGTITDARKLRGKNSLVSGNIYRRLGEYSSIVIPLIIKAMRRAQTMSLALDSRAFGVRKKRTWLVETKMSALDFFALSAGICFSALLLTADCMLKLYD